MIDTHRAREHRGHTFVVLEDNGQEKVHEDEHDEGCVDAERDEVESVCVVEGEPHVGVVDRGDENKHVVVARGEGGEHLRARRPVRE